MNSAEQNPVFGYSYPDFTDMYNEYLEQSGGLPSTEQNVIGFYRKTFLENDEMFSEGNLQSETAPRTISRNARGNQKPDAVLSQLVPGKFRENIFQRRLPLVLFSREREETMALRALRLRMVIQNKAAHHKRCAAFYQFIYNSSGGHIFLKGSTIRSCYVMFLQPVLKRLVQLLTALQHKSDRRG